MLFKHNLFIFLFILGTIVNRVHCQSNDTEITTESLIDNDGSNDNEGSDENLADESPQPVSSSSSIPSSTFSSTTTSTTTVSSTSAKSNEETRTQPTLTDDNINDEISSKDDSEFTSNNNDDSSSNNDDSSLFSIAPGSSSSNAPSDSSAVNEKSDDEAANVSSPAPSSSSSTSSTQPKDKASYEECVALGNADCGNPPDEDGDSEEESNRPKLEVSKEPAETPSVQGNTETNKNNNNNQIDNNDDNKSNESQEQKSKFWYDELPLKVGLPFVLLIFVLFVIIFLLFLAFLIQDSLSRRNESDSNNDTIKIKTGKGTQKINLNQLQMLEKRMRAAREDVDLQEVNVQSLNDKKDDGNDDHNNNLPNEFENIALQDKSTSSRM